MRHAQASHHVPRLHDAERFAMPLIACGRHGPQVLAAGERRCAVLRLDAIQRLASLRVYPEYRRRPSIGADDLIADCERPDGGEPGGRQDLAEYRLRTP